MHHETIEYQFETTKMLGYCSWQNPKADSNNKLPTVLIVHAWRGQDDFSRNKANELAEKGYLAFSIDLYGNRKNAQNDEEAASLMTPLFFDRKEVINRLSAAYEVIKKHPVCDSDKIAIIGFCFGGLCSIELFKSGIPLKGAVSFHGLLGNRLDDKEAEELPIAENIKGSLLVLHGFDDPSVPPSVVTNFENVITTAHVDWQLHTYGNTMHAFTNPEAHNRSIGNEYNEKAANRAWNAMYNFFDEIFA